MGFRYLNMRAGRVPIIIIIIIIISQNTLPTPTFNWNFITLVRKRNKTQQIVKELLCFMLNLNAEGKLIIHFFRINLQNLLQRIPCASIFCRINNAWLSVFVAVLCYGHFLCSMQVCKLYYHYLWTRI